MTDLHRIAATLADMAVPIGTLIPYPGNARVHADATLAESLQVNQQYRPLVVQRGTNHILAGNGTWKAALALGWTHVAATYVDCDDTTAKRIVLVDNRASDIASYDNDALRALLAEVQELPGTGYSAEAFSALVGELETGNGQPEPAAPDEFPAYDESIPTQYTCPMCAYSWSGRPGPAPADEVAVST